MTNKTYTLDAKDSSTYEAGYQIFLNRSNFRDRIALKFAELVSTQIQTSSVLKILDVGCGDGKMTEKYLQPLKQKTKSIELWLSEPAEASLELARNALKNEAAIVYAGQTVPDIHNCNLIIASYVFYHLTPDTLVNLSKQLKINGSLAIMMGTSDNPFKTHPGLVQTVNHGSTDKLQPVLTLLEQTSNFKISRHKVDTFLDINGLKDGPDLTSEGKSLLGFSLNKDYGSLSSNALSAVNEIYAEAFNKNGGKIKSVHEIIWIERMK